MKELLAVGAQMLTLCLSIYILNQRRFSLKFSLVMFIGALCIGYPLYILIGVPSIAIILLLCIASSYWKSRGIVFSIIFPIIAIIISVISDYITSGIYIRLFNTSPEEINDGFLNNMYYYPTYFVIAILLVFAVRFLFTRFRAYDLLFRRYGILFAILCVITVVIFYANILIGKQQGFTNANIQANSLLFAFYFILLIGVFMVLTRSVMKEAVMQGKQEQYERLLEYTDNLEMMYTDMQKFRHDYINILLSMSEYIRSKDMEGLSTYFDHKILPISQGMQNNNYKLGTLQNVKVQELKGILSSKLIRAQELHIDAVVEAVEPIEAINMDSVKLCRCLGIILDNAIEEAVKCEASNLRVALVKRSGGLLIAVANSCQPDGPELHQIFEKGFSTKGMGRGLGLSNLREIVSQCAGVTLDTYRKDGQFIQELEVY
ncbi:two-component system sensor histidine kinase AgrC [Paenibacillus sp. PastF-1]|nr:GHKL domain-containing protein [Paenibacillus sp. PastM-3]MDF9843916.1 two-component system sensor histidine kinase AgrC [Paenibacillus sp. PastF-2]MDF9850521.1 two-component system sensor histidine kinase AgrC [Paenibacillus sp. PastM-2]MDF9856247.1 two-component system sensor histidine kinase AgrC [Paenibacillus sp. PastF-1]MDH6481524.1 two-component system sensor histidine kinase AgrC [Paenibacillus sp. PastH-2]MDH6509838.1 two-component system sensor histidine kinase AgrC [Paenibacillus